MALLSRRMCLAKSQLRPVVQCFVKAPDKPKNSSSASSSSSSSKEPTPYDFAENGSPKGTDVESNPFADFGSNIEISDDELPF